MKVSILRGMLFAVLGCIPFIAFSETYFDCIKSDGSISYRAEPCRKGEKESRRFDVNLNDFDTRNKEFAGGASMPLDLYRQRNGNYFVSGSVGGYPVDFVVDTGASITSISKQAAATAGINECRMVKFNTANGEVAGCVAIVSAITFGNFHVGNVDVAVMPNMAGALLGMNVLSQFKMEQRGSMLRISK